MPSDIEIVIISPHVWLEETARQLMAGAEVATVPSQAVLSPETNLPRVVIIDTEGRIELSSAAAPAKTLQKPIALTDFANALHAQASAALRMGNQGIAIGHFLFIPLNKTLLYQGEGQPVEIRLTEKETTLIHALHGAGGVMEKEKLLAEAWGYQAGVDTHTLETHIYRLRQKIQEHCAIADFILTEANGYRLTY